MNKKYQQSKFIISLILLTISLTLILAFNSYWQYGIEDQSEIIGKIKNYENTNNILGGFGALTSSFFIRLFGVGAYLIPLFIILFSLKIWLKIKRINLLNLFPQHIFFILWIPLFFSSVNNKLLSGKIGLVLSEKLTILIGQVGVIITLLISIIIFIVLTFDIDTKKIFNNIKVLKQFLKTKKEIINNTKTKNDIKKSREDENVKEEEKKDEKLEEELIVDIPDGDKKVNENIINQEDNIISYEFPKLDLLKEYENKISIDDEELEANKRLIEATLKEFKIDVTVERATVGPTITLYEIVPDEGVRIAKIKNLENDIALRIKAVGVRIIAPLPGKGTVGIEVPNQNPTTVSMKDVISSETFQKSDFELPIALGKTISNETFVMD